MKSIEVIIDNAWDPRNYDAIINNCLGFCIHNLYLYHSYNNYPPLPKHPSLNIAEIKDLEVFVKEKKEQDFIFVAADFNESAVSIFDFDFPDKCILVFGAEKRGISKELQQLCNLPVYIPMVGLVKSYNISVSMAIFCYQLNKARFCKRK